MVDIDLEGPGLRAESDEEPRPRKPGAVYKGGPGSSAWLERRAVVSDENEEAETRRSRVQIPARALIFSLSLSI